MVVILSMRLGALSMIKIPTIILVVVIFLLLVTTRLIIAIRLLASLGVLVIGIDVAS